MSEKNESLLEELDEIYRDMQTRLKKASFLGKNIADKLGPVEDILLFVGKVVKKVEELEKENIFLLSELEKLSLEVAQQHRVLTNGSARAFTKEELGMNE